MTQLLAQCRAEVVTRGRIPDQDGSRFVGTSRERIGALINDVLGNRCGLYEVDKVAHISTQEAATREPRVIVLVATVYCELQLGTSPQQRIRLVPVRTFPQRLRGSQREDHRDFAAASSGIRFQGLTQTADAVAFQCPPGHVLVLDDYRRRVATAYHDVWSFQLIVPKRTLGFLLHMPTQVSGLMTDQTGNMPIEQFLLKWHLF